MGDKKDTYRRNRKVVTYVQMIILTGFIYGFIIKVIDGMGCVVISDNVFIPYCPASSIANTLSLFGQFCPVLSA